MVTATRHRISICDTPARHLSSVTESLFVTCRHCGRSIPAPKGRRQYCDDAECIRQRAALRQRERRNRRTVPVTTVTFGTNEQLIADVAALYLADGDVVADVTYSTGRFWKKTDTSRYQFLASDLMPERPHVLGADFRALPYRAGAVDALIFDPPYIHSPGKGMLATRYNGLATTDMISYADIMQLYKDGMAEACRVLRDGGQLWVKCKDTLASDRQRWSHITIYELAQELGLYSRDLFLLVPPAPSSVTTGRWARQIHARKVHSYLWIFETGGYKRRG
jgi:hypothetical protein